VFLGGNLAKTQPALPRIKNFSRLECENLLVTNVTSERSGGEEVHATTVVSASAPFARTFYSGRTNSGGRKSFRSHLLEETR